MARVLVVDDDVQIRRTLDLNLRARGYEVELAASGGEALQLAAGTHPDVVLLDLGLPDIDGTDVVDGLRGWTAVPIVVLSAREREHEKVEALDAGADDYVTKPFGMDELVARLRAALRRRVPPTTEAAVVQTPDFVIDLTRKSVSTPGGDVHLSRTQWNLVELLTRNPDRLVTHQQLLEAGWGPDETKTRYVHVFMAQIRQRLEPDSSRPRYFLTETGIGYRFHDPAAPREAQPRHSGDVQ
jgi:two-component system KDP operon response regulator KdpE